MRARENASEEMRLPVSDASGLERFLCTAANCGAHVGALERGTSGEGDGRKGAGTSV
jgi:hypothetical protein